MDLTAIKNNYGIIGRDSALDRALEIALSIAPTDLTALIIGESGVGKDIIPRIIHDKSPRRTKKYFAVNCGAIPEGIIDSELFGHEKGAFTGAIDTRKGYFEEADGGTLFLDEIGDLPLTSQVKLLRVLQNGEYLRVGSSQVRTTNVRVVVATNNNLEHAVQTGKFRADLYYRLNAVTINMPSLRDRREDIPLLFRQFVNDFTDRNRTPRISLDTGATIVLQNYRFPGNIRQLKHIAESMCAIEGPKLKDGVITMDIARNYIPREADTLLPATVEKSGNITLEDRDRIIASIIQLRQEIDYIKGVLSKGAHISQPVIPDVAPPSDVRNFEEDVTNEIDDQSDIEQEINNGESEPEEDYSVKKSLMIQIEKALEKHNGNRAAAAKELGISERTLYRKLKQKNADEKK